MKIGRDKLILIVIVALISFVVGHYHGDKIISGSSSNHEFTSINKEIDGEHGVIIDAVDRLYDACDKHWKTEDRLYEEGIKKMPKGHKDVSQIWKNHRQEHMDSLTGIKQLKEKLLNHINTKDTEVFHWL
mgnify:FL=1|jgi:hypothetical protein